jgi:hypothetical protein
MLRERDGITQCGSFEKGHALRRKIDIARTFNTTGLFYNKIK